MENNVIDSINAFIGEKNANVNAKRPNTYDSKRVVLDEREGLIERIDKQYVTSDGRMLLREQY